MKQYRCKRVEFLDILRQEKYDLHAAIEIMNINYKTYISWLNKYKWFKEAIEDMERLKILYIEGILLKRIKDGDTKAAQLWFNKYSENADEYEDEEYITVRLKKKND